MGISEKGKEEAGMGEGRSLEENKEHGYDNTEWQRSVHLVPLPQFASGG